MKAGRKPEWVMCGGDGEPMQEKPIDMNNNTNLLHEIPYRIYSPYKITQSLPDAGHRRSKAQLTKDIFSCVVQSS